MTKYAIAINTGRCVGCHTCSLACKMSNNIPDGMLWNRVLTEGCDVIDGAQGTYPNLERNYLPLACQHCENAACLRACPTGATYKDEEGRVEIDYDKCIGCRMCMAACPYNARTFNWKEPKRITGADYGHKDVPARKKGVMEKCTLCPERTGEGKEPMCVAVCPAGARVFGDLDDPDSEISKLKRERNVRILLEDMGTKPQVFYFE
ncbi:4Fe-4S dicluster domain-containing protein [Slackia heliotrinireducens]|jgi:molybdopterin-containing oxidoreductase family iron-sulfur binding subunit|uniref:Fe-S-cluster-containing hydrogenase subunit n=1 Tax=Slackia heliotrinireducens (strain ATCC 29202 / DSM 20476 / NCTC 11029 / RHS 1) TaxID=471855 RepID=C7N1J0_SLAHD|nr:4Fe-4S dicluster domain-containing protein [Slackia heliotrinireducens]ACV21282.1 Fe-S-cluster-containing hydrogenase subunit [Slackia heliotrinireducens DSM 20476]VEG98717.1 DMSO reductase iron-sulfur subunit [Slackia heliotrinireducens]